MGFLGMRYFAALSMTGMFGYEILRYAQYDRVWGTKRPSVCHVRVDFDLRLVEIRFAGIIQNQRNGL